MHLLEDIECNPRNEGSEKAAGDIRSALMMAGKSQGVSVKAASKGEPVAQATMPSAASVQAPAAACTEEASVVASRRSSSDGSVQEVSNLTVTAPPLKKPREEGRGSSCGICHVCPAAQACRGVFFKNSLSLESSMILLYSCTIAFFILFFVFF